MVEVDRGTTTESGSEKRQVVRLSMFLIGSASVGKSSLMNQYVHKKFSAEAVATIGTDFLQ